MSPDQTINEFVPLEVRVQAMFVCVCEFTSRCALVCPCVCVARGPCLQTRHSITFHAYSRTYTRTYTRTYARTRTSINLANRQEPTNTEEPTNAQVTSAAFRLSFMHLWSLVYLGTPLKFMCTPVTVSNQEVGQKRKAEDEPEAGAEGVDKAEEGERNKYATGIRSVFYINEMFRI